MRPIIVYVSEKDGTINLSREEFENMIFQAYEQGKADTTPRTVTWSRPQDITITPCGTDT